ncbi:N-acetyltransferase [Fibrisoma montanum]|uniref:N-acetyltransferase n=1 Tax=Fibrisoma montanum TaxID=2305895 RepID=A0A418MCH4_9BACT|nr:GNAT family protein [Fibrisoma montanum]RIV24083.1 N-acetyltransferase [Fibrisoma montanum]
MFTALYADSITLHLINDDNVAQVYDLFRGYPDSDIMLMEITESYLPDYEDGQRIKYGFYAMLNDELAGLSLLGIDSVKPATGYTGADTLTHMRGKGVAPRSKPHLFYLAFELLGLNRVETGCFVSNLSSKRSIEKTAGFQLEGIMRESGLNDQGAFEDEYLYAILRRDWERLYDKSQVQVL